MKEFYVSVEVWYAIGEEYGDHSIGAFGLK